MKVFLSWSGDRSKAVAEALRDWLPLCIQSIEPWMSAADLDKGQRWFDQVEEALGSSEGQGIFCLTPENLQSPWLNFEAGYLAAGGRKARVRGLLIGLQPSDVKPPISLFQLTSATRTELHALVNSLNQYCAAPVRDQILARSFDSYLPEFECRLQQALTMDGGTITPALGSAADQITDDLLATTRRLELAVTEQGAQLRAIENLLLGRTRPVHISAQPHSDDPVADPMAEQRRLIEEHDKTTAHRMGILSGAVVLPRA